MIQCYVQKVIRGKNHEVSIEVCLSNKISTCFREMTEVIYLEI